MAVNTFQEELWKVNAKTKRFSNNRTLKEGKNLLKFVRAVCCKIVHSSKHPEINIYPNWVPHSFATVCYWISERQKKCPEIRIACERDLFPFQFEASLFSFFSPLLSLFSFLFGQFAEGIRCWTVSLHRWDPTLSIQNS